MNIMLARQPIFDYQEQVIGYQIYHHGGASAAVRHSVLDALLETGTERITGGNIAFVGLSPELMLTGAVELLDPRGVVLVLNGAERDQEVVERCRSYRSRGYHLALDVDPAMDPASPLFDVAEVARLDVRAARRDQLGRFARQLRSRRIQLLAEGVENSTLRDECLEMGFRMFQGIHFNQPEVVSRRDISVEHLQVFRLLKDLRNEAVSDAQILESFRQDPGLTYRFLRVVNSAAIGGQRVDSIGYAIRLMGRESLSRWLSLLLLSPFAGRGVNAEIASTMVTRARFCELLAEACGRPWAADSLFTIGLFSRLDMLLGSPLEYIVEQVSFSDDVRKALIGREGPDGQILSLVEAYETGRWDEVERCCGALGITTADLPRLQYEALPWGAEHPEPCAADAPAAAAPAPAARERGRTRRWLDALLAVLRRRPSQTAAH